MQTKIGPYTITEPIGQGGFSSVWLARHTTSGEPVAIKLVPIDSESGQPLRARLRAEAEILFELDHPQLVKLYAHGTDDSTDWIVMEWLEGGTLADRLQVRTIEPITACQLTLSLLDVLKYIHERGVVHRDIKPSNLLFDADGQLHLGDFGIAQIARDADLNLTREGVGSWSFMAPEQRAKGQPVGPRADLYATACTLYHMLTGASPMDLFLASSDSPRWVEVPKPLQPLLRAATSVAPEDRPSDAHSMMHQLKAAMQQLDSARAPQDGDSEPAYSDTYEPTVEGRSDGVLPSRPSAQPPAIQSDRVRFSALDSEYTPRYQRRRDAPETALSPSQRPTRAWVWVALCVGLVTLVSLISRPVIERTNEPMNAPEWVDAGETIQGEWIGKWSSYSARLSLVGERLTPSGDLVVTLPEGDQIRSHLGGTFNPQSRVLRLFDEHPDARFVEYNLTLDMPNLTMQGTITTHDGSVEPCVMVRTQPVEANTLPAGTEDEPLRSLQKE